MKNKVSLNENKPKISGFFPFLNDWGTIGSLVLALDSSLQKIASEYEILVIDDGSNEEAKDVLRSLEKAFPKWKSVKDELPEIDVQLPEYARHIKVIACWGKDKSNVAEMLYCSDVVRGKEVRRFKWHDRLSPWEVTHWMLLPEPPEEK